ncbi:hypothetical protein MUS1_00470 [Marinomonas ushuaiensis DSM 15871]|uniref:HTH lysR-type domain-containing protein n=1 Tax=Marinomonas ushuaiensis DSM 15871 TaxID=1122207 RepID=X7EC08_9GAMM|nr:LysR family transcriptional regulator [Marinomonas ushuaiensis]ETX12663.1 hypothetical protein MUS1_00470 [Marinomonas ushuaiensis DSM 15871]
MQSRLLQSFLVVAEKKSITEASNTLHVSQPALTKSIQKLEDDLGVKLFERLSVGVQLTKFGVILQRHAKIMDNEYRHAVSSIGELRDGRSRALRIGAGPVWLVSILPPVIAQFQREHPDVKISLIGGVIDTLLPALINGELDLICVSLDFPNRSEIIKEPLFDVCHVLIASPEHPLTKQPFAETESIHKYPWMVLKSDYIGTERISSFFATNGLKPPQIALETTSIYSLLEGLKGGDYIAHIPKQMLPLAQSMGLQEIKLKQVIWETAAGLVQRSSNRNSSQMNELISLIRNLPL